MKPVVLVVEDNERNRKLVRTVLEFRGFDVVEAGDGEQGVSLARERLPALILMDIDLPKLDGVSALARIRSDPAMAAIPVVAVTASVTPRERERVVNAGFNAYIAKPIDITSFGDMIEAITGKAGTDA